jgi:hypothetical protein
MKPKTDGHVFILEQSERAPLILLMEVRRDENGLDDKESSSEPNCHLVTLTHQST